MGRVLVITADDPRHKYFVSCVRDIFNCDCDIIVVDKSSDHISKVSDEALKLHSEELSFHEKKYFKNSNISENVRQVTRAELNMSEFVETLNFDDYVVCFVFGSPILKSVWFKNELLKINLHLGLSPYYVGSGTLFWPFHNNDIRHAGITWHELTEVLDMGRPVIRYKFKFAQGNYYDLINIILKHAILEGLNLINDRMKKSENLFVSYYERAVRQRKYIRSDITAAAINRVNSKYNQNQKLKYDITSC